MGKSVLPIALILFLFGCMKKPEEIYSESGTKEINGTQLFYKVIGSGEPILIIHGGPGLSHSYLLPNLKTLGDKYKLIFYDQRACGNSSLDVESSSIKIDNFVEDIDQLRNSFGIEKINIMAHSWGGILAMKYAIKYPNFIKSLILINSVGASSDISVSTNQILKERFTDEDSILRAEIFKSEEFQMRDPRAIESLMKIGFKHQFYNEDYIDSLNLSLNDNYIKTSQLLQNLAQDLTAYDFHPDLKNIKTPTLLIYGSYDPLTKLAGKKINEMIYQSEFKILDSCGHFPFIEKQNEFKKTVINFIEFNR